MTQSRDKKTGFAGWCFGAGYPFPMSSTEEMSEMMKRFCGNWGSFGYLPMMGMFRNEDGSLDWDRMMEMMRVMTEKGGNWR